MIISDLRESISRLVVSSNTLTWLYAKLTTKTHGIRLKKFDNGFLFSKNDKAILIRRSDLFYVTELTNNFDFLFESVQGSARLHQGLLLVDFSRPADHLLTGWSHFPIHFPSFSEPVDTTNQYISFLELAEGEVILDLGAYAGVSAMQFAEKVGSKGKVIALEADISNFQSAEINFQRFASKFNYCPTLLFKAAWKENTEIKFSSEGNVGSAVLGMNSRQQNTLVVEALSLSGISELLNLSKIDAIKLDIEGAELEVFKDSKFFDTHNPRIIFEAVPQGPRAKRYDEACSLLESYGYKCERIHQIGSKQILIGATRDI